MITEKGRKRSEDDMEMQGSRTQGNLQAALSRESRNRLRYEWYAQQAKAQGYVHIGQLFDETAEKEQAHGEMWLRALGEQTDTAQSLARAAEGEREEWADLYAEYARIARQEGFAEIAGQFEKIAAVERGHEQRFRLALSQMQAGQVFHQEGECAWVCANCGHVAYGADAPENCPACGHGRAYFSRQEEAY